MSDSDLYHTASDETTPSQVNIPTNPSSDSNLLRIGTSMEKNVTEIINLRFQILNLSIVLILSLLGLSLMLRVIGEGVKDAIFSLQGHTIETKCICSCAR